jgi:hypothetical protein
MAIAFDQFEYGLQCLEQARDFHSGDALVESTDQPAYLDFLQELEIQVAKMPHIYPQTFASRYTFEASKARFQGSAELPSEGGSKKIVSQIIILVNAITNRFRWSKWLKRKLVRMVTRARVPQRRNSTVEELLIKFGLVEQARILKEKRLAQSV